MHLQPPSRYLCSSARLEQRDYEFTTDNDSELIAVYLADKLSQGIALRDALATSIDDLDGTFSFLVSTRDEIGYPRLVKQHQELLRGHRGELGRLCEGQVAILEEVQRQRAMHAEPEQPFVERNRQDRSAPVLGDESEVAVPPPSEPTAARTDRRENAGKLRRPETAAGCTVPVTAHHGLRGPLHRCPRGRERLRGPVPPGEEPAPRPPAPLELLRLAPLTARCRARRTDYGGGSPNNLR